MPDQRIECPACDTSLTPEAIAPGCWLCACCATTWRDDTHQPGGRSTTTSDRPACGSGNDTNARPGAAGADGMAVARLDGARGRGVQISGALAPEHRAALKFSVSQQNDFRPGGRK